MPFFHTSVPAMQSSISVVGFTLKFDERFSLSYDIPSGAFDDTDIVHVEGEVDPVRDLDIISEELRLKDEETLNKSLEKLDKLVVRGNDKKLKPEFVSFTFRNKIIHATWSQQSDLSNGTVQALHLWQNKHESLRYVSRSPSNCFSLSGNSGNALVSAVL